MLREDILSILKNMDKIHRDARSYVLATLKPAKKKKNPKKEKTSKKSRQDAKTKVEPKSKRASKKKVETIYDEIDK